MRIPIIVAALLGSLSSATAAQEAAGPRAGGWAAEVNFSGFVGTPSGSLLRFRSDRSAWVVGLTASVGQRDTENTGSDEDETTTSVGIRAGVRSLRSPGSATRPTLGFGILGQHSVAGQDSRNWAAGAYTEFGVTRFFGSSFSLGAFADLELRYSETRIGGGLGPDPRLTELRLTLDAVRVAATVYF